MKTKILNLKLEFKKEEEAQRIYVQFWVFKDEEKNPLFWTDTFFSKISKDLKKYTENSEANLNGFYNSVSSIYSILGLGLEKELEEGLEKSDEFGTWSFLHNIEISNVD